MSAVIGPPSPTELGLTLGFVAGASGLGLAAAPVVLPDLADDLGLAVAQTAWILAAFSLTLAVMTPVFGRVTDRRGARGVLGVGAGLGLTGAVIVLVGSSLPVLIAGRLVQGAGAAALSIVAFGIAGHHLEGAGRARAFGLLTACSSMFLGAGPLVGAGIAAGFGWRGALAAPVLATVAVVPLLRLAPPVAAARRSDLDLVGAGLVLVAGAGATALLQARATGLGLVTIVVTVAATALAALALVSHVARQPAGFLPRAVVGNRAFVGLSTAAAAVMCGFLGMGFLGPLLLLGEGRSWGTIHVGLALLPAAAVAALVAAGVGSLRPRVSVERILIALGIGSAVGIAVAGLGHALAPLVVVGVASATAGFAGAQVVLLDRVSELVEAADRGVALGVFNLIFVTGGALGAALAGALVDLDGPPLAALCVAVLPLCAVPLVWLAGSQAPR